MKSKAITALFVAVLIIFSGCDAFERMAGFSGDIAEQAPEHEANAAQLKQSATYYNEYLGVQLTVPKGWWLYDISTDNFAAEKGFTSDAASLDISKSGDYALIYLISFANLQYSVKDNHLCFTVYAETDPFAADLDEYAQSYTEYMLQPFEDGTALVLADSFSSDISGTTFQVREFTVPQEGGNYSVISLLCQLDERYFLAIEVDFWPDNSSAVSDIVSVLEKNLTLTAVSREV